MMSNFDTYKRLERKYSPDQARDDHGRFGEGVSSSIKYSHHGMIASQMHKGQESLGHKVSKITQTNEGLSFTVHGNVPARTSQSRGRTVTTPARTVAETRTITPSGTLIITKH
jgi:hypothetical protein